MRLPRIPTVGELLRFLIALLFLAVCIYLNTLNQVTIERYFHIHMNRPTLFDLGFLVIPKIHQTWLCDYVNLLLIFTTLPIILLFHPRYPLVFKRFFVIHGLMYLIRSPSIIVTLLPNPDTSCIPKTRPESNIMIEAFRVLTVQRTTCGDVMFSGHSGSLTVMALLFQTYSREVFERFGGEWIRIGKSICVGVNWLIAITGFILIIGTRFHYTIDVLIAVVIATLVFFSYHHIVRSPTLSRRIPFIYWFDGVTEEVGPRQSLKGIDAKAQRGVHV